jgi:hypothetical protein
MSFPPDRTLVSSIGPARQIGRSGPAFPGRATFDGSVVEFPFLAANIAFAAILPLAMARRATVPDMVELEARISAIEMLVVTQLLQSGVSHPGFDPRAFAVGRRDAWVAIGRAACEGCSSREDENKFTEAYAVALERLGNLLVELSAPVQEAIDEVNAVAAGRDAGV